MKSFDIKNILSNVFVFKELNDHQLDQVVSFSKLIDLNRSSDLFAEGEVASNFFVIESGKLKVFKVSPEGKEQTIHILGSGDLLAEAAIFDKKVYPANCSALTKSVLVQIDRNHFVDFLTKNPDASIKLLAGYSKKLRQLVSLVEDLSLNDIKRRFAKYLLNNCQNVENGYECKLAVSKKELAAFLGTTPEGLSRAINTLRKDNIINPEGDRVIIVDKSNLEALILA